MLSYSSFLKYLEILKISKVKGKGTELITLSFPPSVPTSTIMSKLKEEKNEIKNVKAKRTRVAVEEALDSILSYLSKEKRKKDVSYLFLSGLVKDELFFKCFESQSTLNFKYRCSDSFDLSEYKENISFRKYYLIVLDLNGACVGSKEPNGIFVLKKFDSYIPSKTKKGGQSSKRYAEIRANETRQLFARVSSFSNNLFIAEKRVTLIGGCSPTIDKFVADKYLLKEVKDTYKGPYYLQNDDEAALEELLLLSKDDQIESERKVQEDYLKRNNNPLKGGCREDSVILVPSSILFEENLLEQIVDIPETCNFLVIDNYGSKGSEFNYKKEVRVVL